MNKNDVIKSWKNPAFRSKLSLEQLQSMPSNPVGEPLEDLQLLAIRGGDIVSSCSKFENCGWVASISGECNGGSCCNPFYSWFKANNPNFSDIYEAREWFVRFQETVGPERAGSFDDFYRLYYGNGPQS